MEYRVFASATFRSMRRCFIAALYQHSAIYLLAKWSLMREVSFTTKNSTATADVSQILALHCQKGRPLFHISCALTVKITGDPCPYLYLCAVVYQQRDVRRTPTCIQPPVFILGQGNGSTYRVENCGVFRCSTATCGRMLLNCAMHLPSLEGPNAFIAGGKSTVSRQMHG